MASRNISLINSINFFKQIIIHKNVFILNKIWKHTFWNILQNQKLFNAIFIDFIMNQMQKAQRKFDQS